MPENRSIEFEKYLEIFKDRIRSARYEGAGDDSQSLVSSERAFTAAYLQQARGPRGNEIQHLGPQVSEVA